VLVVKAHADNGKTWTFSVYGHIEKGKGYRYKL